MGSRSPALASGCSGVMKSKQSGVVEKIGKKDVVVNFGAMKLTVGMDQVEFADGE